VKTLAKATLADFACDAEGVDTSRGVGNLALVFFDEQLPQALMLLAFGAIESLSGG